MKTMPFYFKIANTLENVSDLVENNKEIYYYIMQQSNCTKVDFL